MKMPLISLTWSPVISQEVWLNCTSALHWWSIILFFSFVSEYFLPFPFFFMAESSFIFLLFSVCGNLWLSSDGERSEEASHELKAFIDQLRGSEKFVIFPQKPLVAGGIVRPSLDPGPSQWFWTIFIFHLWRWIKKKERKTCLNWTENRFNLEVLSSFLPKFFSKVSFSFELSFR